MSISTYEGASAVFTFANNPTVLAAVTVVVIAVTLYALAATFIHEKHSYDLPDDKLPKLK
ncbi:hypothetical protein [Pseudomonas sp. Q1-7]|uniref:hypothetical protein n=1 Tax=Pseudomonas sp. Q1-7 TaxID=3020843 RepID=UPI0023017F64|nr:hypothetical protein [Pseudomonas sp. Q1-7]